VSVRWVASTLCDATQFLNHCVQLLQFFLRFDLIGDVVLNSEVVDDAAFPVIQRPDGKLVVEKRTVFLVISQSNGDRLMFTYRLADLLDTRLVAILAPYCPGPPNLCPLDRTAISRKKPVVALL